MSRSLTREVLPPRQVPTSMRDMARMHLKISEARARAAITRAIWTLVALVGLATLTVRLLGML